MYLYKIYRDYIYIKAFATERNDVAPKKKNNIKHWGKCQDFQVENITMGHPICLYIFYSIFYFNTDF